MQETKCIGRSVKRLEDRPLLVGRGRFAADLAFPGMLEAAFVRIAAKRPASQPAQTSRGASADL